MAGAGQSLDDIMKAAALRGGVGGGRAGPSAPLGLHQGAGVKKQAVRRPVVVMQAGRHGRQGPSGTLSAMGEAGNAPSAECIVGEDTDIASSAGYLCSTLRDHRPVPVVSSTPASSHKALKMVALAHQYLDKDNQDLYCQVDFPEYATSKGSAKMKLHMFNKRLRCDLSHVSAQVFCSASSVPEKVAGYIANNAREIQSGRLALSTCGEPATLNALKAVFCARHYLQVTSEFDSP